MIVGFLLVLLTFIGVRDWLNRPLHITKQAFIYTYDGSSMPYPKLPKEYLLIYQPTKENNGSGEIDYLTHRTISQAISDVKYLCDLYGFSMEPSISGQVSVNNSPYFNQTTIQCFKDNNGWEFNINSGSYTKYLLGFNTALEDRSLVPLPVNLAAYTYLDVMSIGPPVIN